MKREWFKKMIIPASNKRYDKFSIYKSYKEIFFDNKKTALDQKYAC